MFNYKAKKRISPIKLDQSINYKDVNLLKIFISEYGKILSRRTTNLTVKQQKELKKAVVLRENINRENIN